MAAPLSPNLDWKLANPKWAASLNPLLRNALNSVSVLENISLVTGTNVINHFLGRNQQGWFLVDQQGAAVVYRNAPFNSSTLSLSSSADVMVSIGVF